MGIFGKLFGGEKGRGPETGRERTAAKLEKEKSIMDWLREIDALEGKGRDIQMQCREAAKTIDKLKTTSVGSGPFSEIVKTMTELRAKINELTTKAKTIEEGFKAWTKEKNLSRPRYPSEAFKRIQEITSSSDSMAIEARNFSEYAQLAQKAYDLFQRGEISEKIREKIVVSPEKVREGGGEWLPEKTKTIERKRVIERAPQGWEKIEDVIRDYRDYMYR